MNDAELTQLTNEVNKAHRAETFYKEFVESFVADKRAIIFEAFESVAPQDVENLSELRRMLSTISAFDTEIRQYIETGKLATATLKSVEKH